MTNKTELTKNVKQFLLDQGADIVGICSAADWPDDPGFTPQDSLPGAKSVVVVGLRVHY
jgi:hypothetical protein